MLIILCALTQEGRPFIDNYRLKKIADSPFPVYQNETIALCITGIGPMQMACAVGYMGQRFPQQPAWLNFGIAGSKCDPLYSLVMPSEVNFDGNYKVLYPSYPFKPKIPLRKFCTYSLPQAEIKEGEIVDMEAYTYFQMASKFSCLECIHSIKCISDRGISSFQELPKEDLGNTLLHLFPYVREVSETLMKLQSTHFPLIDLPIDLFYAKWNLSLTEKILLQNLLRKAKALAMAHKDIEEMIEKTTTFTKCIHLISLSLETKEIHLS